ncbi:RNA polymerase sigma factor [Niastella sp. OAS944]|uniref:RNA polymerase sigma factor n=1 Tax=Niastella sp. OAS944 TaxID=2664089 RepID=UPI00346B21AA|nr:RNA polymerase sigma-70 factor (ECF subfamily) [Chitinophagaceae bacterium OAS944]
MIQTAIHTDNLCWERLLKGDKEALYELYTKYYHTLLFIGLKNIHDSDLVKDVIQQQFLYLWEKRNTLMEAKNVRSYIIISFLRRLTSDWVKARKRVNLEVAYSKKEEEGFETSYEETLIIKDDHEAVSKNLMAVINELPARQRELIILKFYEGLSYDAITQRTGLTHRTVYNKIHEALYKIKQRLVQPAVVSGIQSFFLLCMASFIL